MKKADFTVGQEVFLRFIHTFPEPYDEIYVERATVAKITPKYIYVKVEKEKRERRFEIANNFREKDFEEFQLCLTEKDVHDGWRAEVLRAKIIEKLKAEPLVGLTACKAMACVLDIKEDAPGE